MPSNGHKVAVVMPSYNCERTLMATYHDIDRSVVDELILVDDASSDGSVELAKTLPIHVLKHRRNRGYGGNQKTCYAYALSLGADIVIMVHPDYQYDPRLVPAMATMISTGVYDCVLGSRILGAGQIANGMPTYKYIANRFLTGFQNLLSGQKLSEYHTGYRAFSRQVLESLPFQHNSDDFVFDNEMLAQIIWRKFRIGEVSCPTKYDSLSSSINFSRSVKYGFGVLRCSIATFLANHGLWTAPMFRHPPTLPQMQDVDLIKVR